MDPHSAQIQKSRRASPPLKGRGPDRGEEGRRRVVGTETSSATRPRVRRLGRLNLRGDKEGETMKGERD
jgi:hypothetical protein